MLQFDGVESVLLERARQRFPFMISIDVVAGPGAVTQLAPEWQALVGDTYTSVFSGPGWYQAWMDVFPPPSLALVTARVEGRLVGLLPLARLRTDARGLYLRLVAPWARGDYQPIIAQPELAAEVIPSLLDAAIRHFGRSGVYWWPNIPEDDDSLNHLRSYLARSGMPWFEERELAPRINFYGGDYARVEAGWSGKHKRDMRRRARRLEERGPLSLWAPKSVEEALPVLEEFFDVHDAKWLAQGYPGMFRDPKMRALYTGFVKRLLGNGLHFSTLRCGEVHVSYHLGCFSGGWIQWYRPSYRPEFHECSPTKVHVAALVEDGCRAGYAGLDFLLGGENYKGDWCNESREVVGIHAGFRRWSPSYFWFSTGKPYLRSKFQMEYLRARAWMQRLRGGPQDR